MNASPPLTGGRRIAYFITPHGYGHAARACAVMAALLDRRPGTHFDVFTRLPEWFFQSTLDGSFTYHELLTDIGLAQKTALSEDLPETMRRLGQLLPFDRDVVGRVAQQLRQIGCRLVMCDIAPMGIAVAREAGIPSLLIENFTWDYIYDGYLTDDDRLGWYIDYLAGIFERADYCIQTEPVSRRRPCNLTTAPVSRAHRTPATEVRQEMRIPEGAPVVMVSMGGFSWRYRFLDRLAAWPEVTFIVPGDSNGMAQRGQPGALPANLVLLPHHSPFFHPDLVNASDAVVGKVGYSTVAEVYWAGVAMGYVPRPRFRESESLVKFIQREMQGIAFSETQFDDGSWVSLLPELLARPRISRVGTNGADQAARFVSNTLSG